MLKRSGDDEEILFFQAGQKVRVIDVDEDGDPDVVTCEERDNLGVFWYENPTIER